MAAFAGGFDAVFHNAAKAGAGQLRQLPPGQRGRHPARARCLPRAWHRQAGLHLHAQRDHRATHPVEGGTAETVPYGEHFQAPYATTKAIAEKAVLAANDAQLATVALRPRLHLGPGRQPDPAAAGRTRESRPPAHRRQRRQQGRHHLHRQRRAGAFRCVRAPGPGAACAGKAYFISNGEPWPMREVLNGCCARRARRKVHKHLPFRVAYAVGGLRGPVVGVAAAGRATDDAVPGRAAEHQPLVFDGAGHPRFRLCAEGDDGGGIGAVAGVDCG